MFEPSAHAVLKNAPAPQHLAATSIIAAFALIASACNDDDSSDPSPRVTAPAAGAAVSGTTPIRWADIGDDEATVSIELSSDGGMSFGTSIAAGEPNDGAFEWDTTGEADGADYAIRVTQGGSMATSGVFSVDNTNPTIALDEPNGGDFFGTNSTIRWTTTDPNPGTVEIELSDDSGATYATQIAAAAPDTGMYVWNLAGVPEGANYRIRVTPTDAAGNLGASDESDGDFEIDLTAPTTMLIGPNGGETLTSTSPITWTTTDANPGTVDIFLSTDSGATFSETIVEDAPDTGTFNWQTGQTADSMTLRVRVVPTDLAGNLGTGDESDADFTAENLRLRDVAHYSDANGNAVIDAGDEVRLLFDKLITINGPTAADFVLPVAGDTFGAGATFGAALDPQTLLITLGTNPVLTTRGVFNEEETTSGAPSGVELADPITPNVIESTATGIDAAPIGPVELQPQPTPEASLGATGNTPRRATAGDLDGDGDLDIVVAVAQGDPSEVWLNDGDHGWTLNQSFDVDNTLDVAIGDVDGDGDADVVTAVDGANKVWTNDGAGMLTDSGQTLAALESRGVLLADYDGDGDLDAFFANTVQNTVWNNDGLGTFTNSGQNLGAVPTNAIAGGDFDGDGDQDVFAANNGGPSQLWLNNAGTFTASGTLMPVNAQDVAAGDFNGDGLPDVFIAVNGQNAVSLNEGNGEFQQALQLIGNNDNRGVGLMDIDGDGDLDAVVAKNVDSARYWMNDGQGNFTVNSIDVTPAAGVDVVTGLFDGDADEDFLLIVDGGNYMPHRGSVSGGQPLAAFVERAIPAAAAWESGRASTGDVDGDGKLDIVVPDNAGMTHVLRSTGGAGFELASSFGMAGATGGDLFDANGDGNLDYLQRIGDAGVTTDELWLGAGDGTFTNSGELLGLDTFAAGDLDGDGDGDLIVISATALETWDGDGAGNYLASGQVVMGAFGTDVHVADLDGDGDRDVVATTATTIELFENDGLGTFVNSATIVAADTTSSALADLDSDGDLDLVFASSTGGTDLRYSENGGGFSFGVATNALADQTAFEQLVILDANEDGTPDLAAVDQASGEFVLAFGAGDGTFTASPATSIAELGSLVGIDVDGDGDTDLYASKGTTVATADTVVVFE